jgi:pentapeptide MXKDX repeat protein
LADGKENSRLRCNQYQGTANDGVAAGRKGRNVDHSSEDPKMMTYKYVRLALSAAAVSFGLALSPAAIAQTKSDPMMKDTMAKDSMAKDNMAKDGMKDADMKKDAMSKDDMMKKDTMSKDNMAKDTMKK